MTFDEALLYLLGLGHEMLAMKLGLANTEALLGALGHPENSFSCVQIAGTNGKGSTAAMLSRMTHAAGIRTGLYTSPHLVSISERVRVGGAEISREEFARAATVVRKAAEEVARASGALPTFFEQVTAIALVHFREARVEIAVLETGLGGRLDATTAARASVAAITPVALDHQEYLGHTLAKIAAEKAAIVRGGVTVAVCVAPQPPEAEEVIRRRCAEAGLAPRFATREIRVEGQCDEGGRLRVSFVTRRDRYERVCLALRGRHQTVNAALAVELGETITERGYTISREHIIEGLEQAEHAGRLELRGGKPPVLFDGAHNPAGAQALREYLDEFVRAPVTLVFGAMRDKELLEIAAALFPVAHRLILTQPANVRAATPEQLSEVVPSSLDSDTITLTPSAAEAVRMARAQTPPDGLICVTGSLYLVGEVKSILEGKGDNQW